jgi:hypothetical protein
MTIAGPAVGRAVGFVTGSTARNGCKGQRDADRAVLTRTRREPVSVMLSAIMIGPGLTPKRLRQI